MEVTAEKLSEALRGISDLPLPPPDLAPLVSDLRASNAEVVTRDELARYDTGRDVRQTVRALRDGGWLYSLPVSGAWGVAGGFPAPYMGGFVALKARLLVSPQTPACIGGRSAAEVRGWLRRPTAPTIGYAGEGRPPSCLTGYPVMRWEPRIPLDTIHGMPVWKPETLLAFMGSRPGRFPWSDIAEWLWEACEDVDAEMVAAELDGRPAAAWARTAYLVDRGDNAEAAAALAALGPPLGNGPHYFGRRAPGIDYLLPWLPVWSSRFNVVDYLLERNWSHTGDA